MATHKLGFLKVNTSEDGLAFRFGDGKIHRLGLGKKGQPAVEGAYDADGYVDGDGFADDAYNAYEAEDSASAGGYAGRFARASSGGSDYDDDRYDDDYADGDYDDDGYDDGYADDGYDDGYADDGYGDDGYADDGYGDDSYADDGYADDGYADDGYGDGGYDDRYSDQDAADYGEDAGYASENPVLRYIDENDWVTYALLILLPPLGIYLLWRRRLFEQPVRWAVSAGSGIWFIVLLILLISAILSGAGDTTANPPITMNTPTPTVAASAEASPEATDSLLDDALNGGVAVNGSTVVGNNVDGITPAQTVDALAPDVTATPLPGYNGGTAVTGGLVLTTATGPYYHNNSSCPQLESGIPTSNVTEDIAIQRGKVPCPVCYPGIELYYHTADGTYYHSDPNCSNMKNATQITKEAAEKAGQKPCPVCITGTQQSLDRRALKFATSSTPDKSGINVYATSGGQYFHTQSDCSGMRNAQSIGLLQAMLSGKTACPKCASAAQTQVWCTQGGKMYHNKENCSGMRGAIQVTLAEAMILGKERCSTCWGSSSVGFSGNGVAGGMVYVYATKDGQYYHTDATCSGMKNASRVPLSQILQMGRAACPKCAAGAETTVYATKDGQYYHSYATCSGMKNATAGTMAQAMALGKQRCPNCWQGSSGAATPTGTSSSGVYVYATQNGTYYHTNANCSGMKNASRIDLAVAVRYGKTACPTCASAANHLVYSTEGGTYYHTRSDCSGMKNAHQRTLEDALLLGQAACPTCVGEGPGGVTGDGSTGGDTGGSPVTNVQAHSLPAQSGSSGSTVPAKGKYTPGASGVKVYAKASDKYFHGYKQHAGSGARQVSIETALNYGKTACPTCMKVARTTVYAVKGGRYYHSSKTCAGKGAVSGKLASALAYGLDACPVCVTRTKTVTKTHNLKSGTSGIKVYATLSGSYFHTSKSCAGAGASQVTLETAINYGKTPCPSCARSAAKTVYAKASDKYYHSSRAHAGSGASAGYWAVAMAMGKKACPVCIGGSEAYEESDVKYSAPRDTVVYIDVNSSQFYYHRSSRCGDAGMSGGTGVVLEFALGWGFRACPYCNPPTSAR